MVSCHVPDSCQSRRRQEERQRQRLILSLVPTVVVPALVLLVLVLLPSSGEGAAAGDTDTDQVFSRIELKLIRGFSNHLDSSQPMDGYLPDLYVSVNYSSILPDGKIEQPERRFGETMIVYEEQSPKWDETLIYDRWAGSHDYHVKLNGVFHVSIMDQNRPQHTFLGEFTIDLRKVDQINGTVVKQDIVYLNRPTVSSEVVYQLTAWLSDGVKPATVLPLLRADQGITVTEAVTEVVTLDPGHPSVIQIIAHPVSDDTASVPPPKSPDPPCHKDQ